MNNQPEEKISLWQLYLLIITFELGSAIVIGIGNEAKQDAWIAVSIAMLIGIIVVILYFVLFSMLPSKNLYGLMEAAFGKWIAILLCLAYIEYFLYLASRVLRDFAELLKSAIFPDTPIECITLLFMVAVIYILYMGYEVLGRTCEIFSPYLFVSLLFLVVFLMINGSIHLENLHPILADGFTPVLKAVFPSLIGFPFGEMIIFTILITQTTSSAYTNKITLAGLITAGLIIILFTVIKLAVLGPNAAARSAFPLLNTVRLISIANFIERLDSIVVFIMMIGIFIKVSLFFYGGLKGIEYITKRPYRPFIFPIGILISLFSIFIASNFAEHTKEGLQFVPMFLHMPFQIGIPAVTLIILFWKNARKKRVQSDVI